MNPDSQQLLNTCILIGLNFILCRAIDGQTNTNIALSEPSSSGEFIPAFRIREKEVGIYNGNDSMMQHRCAKKLNKAWERSKKARPQGPHHASSTAGGFDHQLFSAVLNPQY